jgi:hypothetical protein
VYVGAVIAVRPAGAASGLEGGVRKEADVRVDAVLRAPATASPAAATLRYEEPTGEARGGVFYTLRAGDRVLVFAGSLGREYPIEVVSGSLPEVRKQVTALRDFAARMDDVALRLHGVDARVRDTQVKLYDSALAALR